jgi:hypothetical protein
MPKRTRPARARATWSRSSAAVMRTSSRACERAITTTSSSARPGICSIASA